MKKIELIEIKLDGTENIMPHPRQEELYDDTVDANFIESIKLHGIKQMPVVAIAENILGYPTAEDGYVIISGHRRITAAIRADFETVICELKHYDNYFDSEVDHIIYNKQRKKTKKEIAGEIIAYKQKLDQIRKDLKDNGLKAVEKYKTFNLVQYVQQDEKGRYFLPLGSEMIEKELGITEKHQKQLNVIFNEDWEQDKIETISVSSLSEKRKNKATENFKNLLAEARAEVDKKDGFSVNKVYNEIMRVWNDIDSIINPKPKEKKSKKKEVAQKWLKVHDFACVTNVDTLNKEVDRTALTKGKDWIHINDGKGKDYLLNVDMLLKYIKEQS